MLRAYTVIAIIHTGLMLLFASFSYYVDAKYQAYFDRGLPILFIASAVGGWWRVYQPDSRVASILFWIGIVVIALSCIWYVIVNI